MTGENALVTGCAVIGELSIFTYGLVTNYTRMYGCEVIYEKTDIQVPFFPLMRSLGRKQNALINKTVVLKERPSPEPSPERVERIKSWKH